MEERAACAHLKRRFEAAGFRIKENQTFDEEGVWFEIDGFDAARRVGYEYVTKEAGDGWDVDGEVIAKLAERRRRGELHVLVVDEADAPDAASLDQAIDAFLKELPAAAEKPAAAQPEPIEPDAEAEAEPEAIEPDDDIAEEVAEADEADEVAEAPAARPAPRKSSPPPTPPAKPAKSTRPPPTPKSAKKKPARKSK